VDGVEGKMATQFVRGARFEALDGGAVQDRVQLLGGQRKLVLLDQLEDGLRVKPDSLFRFKEKRPTTSAKKKERTFLSRYGWGD
jgi:hypothetical protein